MPEGKEKMDMMKVLTICEPFVTPIAERKKQFETRSYPTKYRGTLYIHTSKKIMADPVPDAKRKMPLGCIVIKATLTDCVEMTAEWIEKIKTEQPEEYAYGFYEVGRYAWKLENVEVIEPIPARGMLGIWNYKQQ